jgi:hypothetical protein
MTKLQPLLMLVFLTGCSTTVYKNGQPAFRTYSNVTGLVYRDGDTELRADRIDNSGPNRSVGSVAGTIISGAALFTAPIR